MRAFQKGEATGRAAFSPGGNRIAYESSGVQTSNTQGDAEVYRMSAVDGSANKNLTNNGLDSEDYDHDWGRQTM